MIDEKKPVQLKVVVDEDVDQGLYVNFANIFHNPTEFVIDFGRVVPGKREVKIHSRIITTPFHAKRFMETLAQNIANYEQKYGPISMTFPETVPEGEIPS